MVDPPGPQSLGERLRAARERKGHTLPEAVERLNIRREYMEAIEEDRFTDLPPAPYPEIFLTSYAKFLGLSVRDTLSRYFADSGEIAPRATEKLWDETVDDAPPPKPNRLIWVAVAAAIVILVAIVLLLR